ncbi:MAG: argininosuccinate lyase [Chitinivibrionales bacterium]|nr:argininosuccinate lyase [Chitinivibrionales bacterium]MBD3395008.1 argininosuccinate lyase [Chitinivibrionales bacterium]
MWDGRFGTSPSKLMHEFNASLPVDQVLIEEDIAGSIAWAGALSRARVLTAAETKRIVRGLRRIRDQYRQGKLRLRTTDEDIHMAVERMLTGMIGKAGEKLHTGRSRNDQVATDFRMFVMRALREVHASAGLLQKALVRRAERDKAVIAPGYTHLQQAQPVSLAHYWLSFVFALEREKDRLDHAIRTADVMPLGSGALAGSGFSVDRRALAKKLGFSRVCENSMDAVASRDFVMEALAALASFGVLLSRYADDLIIWSSAEFGFVELDDAWSTGSSMMPQKKNPDSLELIRGKAGRCIGNFTRFASTLKGVGLAYYKDLQEDKEPLIDSVTTAGMSLEVFAEAVRSCTVNRKRIAHRLDSFLFATDLADYLVRKKVPFRTAHKVVGKIVAHCIARGAALDSLSFKELRGFSRAFSQDVLEIFSWPRALAARNVEGGTGMRSVTAQLRTAKGLVARKRK